MEFSLGGRIDAQGILRWNNPRAAQDAFRAMAGQWVTVTIEPGKRRLIQNRKLHAIFGDLSRSTGYTPREWKEYLKAEWIEDGRGTSDQNVDEASEFIEFCVYWAAEHLNLVLS